MAGPASYIELGPYCSVIGVQGGADTSDATRSLCDQKSDSHQIRRYHNLQGLVVNEVKVQGIKIHAEHARCDWT